MSKEFDYNKASKPFSPGKQSLAKILLGFAVGIVAIPIWHKLANVLGKKTTWILGMVLIIIGFIYTGTFAPGKTHFSELLTSIALLNLGFACMWLVAPAMLAEIVDYSTWKYGIEKSATYFSLYAFMSKTSAAVAGSLGLVIAGWYGLDVTATTHDEGSVRGLILAMTWIPLTFVSISLIFIALSPINARRHAIIRRRLDTRAARDVVVEKLQPQNTPKPDIFINTKSALIASKD